MKERGSSYKKTTKYKNMLFMYTERSKRCDEFCTRVAPFDHVYRDLARLSVGLEVSVSIEELSRSRTGT
jgi:hypothetical protein